MRSGYRRKFKTRISVDDIIIGVIYIAATWICTKSFWFLRPMDKLLSFRSTREPRSLAAGIKISSFYCLMTSLGK